MFFFTEHYIRFGRFYRKIIVDNIQYC